MPRIKRWFPVGDDFNSDPELWELTRKCGDRSLRVIFQIFAIGNRNGGALPTMSEAFARVLAGMCQVSATTVSKVWDHAVACSWIVCDPTPRLRNYPYSHKTREKIKSQLGTQEIRERERVTVNSLNGPSDNGAPPPSDEQKRIDRILSDPVKEKKAGQGINAATSLLYGRSQKK